MEERDLEDAELLVRFDAFCKPLLRSVGAGYHRELARDYTLGLLGPGERKTVEPIVRRLRGGPAPARERDTREMLNDDWSHASLMWLSTERLLEQTAGWQAWMVDDTALLKQGTHSVGVANQYAGCVGGLANCQSLVTVSIGQEHISSPCAAQLFLPEKWAADDARRKECHVPTAIVHVAKWRIALRMLDQIEYRNLPQLPVLADAGYGDVSEFRRGLDRRGLVYVVGVSSTFTAVRAGVLFSPPATGATKSNGRPSTRWVPDAPIDVMSIEACARALPNEAWHDVTWRMGSKGEQRGRFAAVRIRPACGIKGGRVRPDDLQPEQWLLMHWPKGKTKPTKAWLSSLPESASIETLITYARMRWRIERDYRESKGLLGLDHFEGRSWCGLHHHACFVIIAQQFLAMERWRALKQLSTIPERVAAALGAIPPWGQQAKRGGCSDSLQACAPLPARNCPLHDAALPRLRASS